jgi:hypothetical protein
VALWLLAQSNDGTEVGAIRGNNDAASENDHGEPEPGQQRVVAVSDYCTEEEAQNLCRQGRLPRYFVGGPRSLAQLAAAERDGGGSGDDGGPSVGPVDRGEFTDGALGAALNGANGGMQGRGGDRLFVDAVLQVEHGQGPVIPER